MIRPARLPVAAAAILLAAPLLFAAGGPPARRAAPAPRAAITARPTLLPTAAATSASPSAAAAMLALAGPLHITPPVAFQPGPPPNRAKSPHHPWHPKLSLAKVILITAAASVATGWIVWKWNHQSNLLARP